jgi:hypothetical protein
MTLDKLKNDFFPHIFLKRLFPSNSMRNTVFLYFICPLELNHSLLLDEYPASSISINKSIQPSGYLPLTNFAIST